MKKRKCGCNLQTMNHICHHFLRSIAFTSSFAKDAKSSASLFRSWVLLLIL
ncbi:hypothetical protein Hanom_Chr10g00899251 [Helianthus anomalus]